MIFSLAVKNIIRMPAKTVLYFLTVFVVCFSVVISSSVFAAVDNAMDFLDNNYVFVATLSAASTGDKIYISDADICRRCYRDVPYNICPEESAGTLPNAESLFSVPYISDISDAPEECGGFIDCKIKATGNLMLEPEFFSGNFKLLSGGFDAGSYCCETKDIVLPQEIAEKYGISIGDKIIRRISENPSVVACREFTVSGIYAGGQCAYITLETYMQEYSEAHQSRPDENISILRADFTLSARDDFSVFVRRANELGLDFSRCLLTLNSSGYDSEMSNLKNLRIFMTVVLCAVLSSGALIIVLFTKYFAGTRKHSDLILRALGMGTRRVRAVFVTEIALTVAVALPLGILCGKMSSGKAFEYIDDRMEIRSETAAKITKNAYHLSQIGPSLERDYDVKLVSSKAPETLDLYVENDHLYIQRYLYDTHAAKYADADKSVWERVRLVGARDVKAFNIRDAREDDPALSNRAESRNICYVEKNSGYNVGDVIRVSLFLPREEFLYQSAGKRMISYNVSQTLLVVGSFDENESVGKNDILTDIGTLAKIYEDYTLYGEFLHFPSD